MADEAERLQEAAGVIEREVRIEASPETVFEMLTDPEQYVRWKGRKAWCTFPHRQHCKWPEPQRP